MPLALADSYSYCSRVARRHARNFYYGFLALPRRKRRALCAVYAFMRYCDDLADQEGAPDSKREMLERWRGSLDRALAGDVSDSPILPAFAHAVETYAIPGSLFHELIDGAEMDLEVQRYERFDDLYDYCYKVASVVGLVCIEVFGYQDPKARQYAEWQGIALQLTNILRDLREDAERGRIYLPLEDLSRFGYTEEDLLGGRRTPAFEELLAFETARAEDYYRRSEALVGLVSRDSRPALRTMANIYRGLLGEISRPGFDVFATRARLSGPTKLLVLCRSFLGL